jgi:hypothetical protein
MTPVAAATPTEYFARIIDELFRLLGWFGPKHGVAGPVLLLILRRAQRLCRRFASLVARIEAGTLRPLRVRPARSSYAEVASPSYAEVASEGNDDRVVKEPDPVLALLPTWRDGWVSHLVPECGSAGGMVEQLVYNVPRVAELYAAEPRLGRYLRPLCRMFGVKPPPWLGLPERPRAPRPPRERAVTGERAVTAEHPEMWRWPHISFRARFGTKKQRAMDAEIDAYWAARKKREEGG